MESVRAFIRIGKTFNLKSLGRGFAWRKNAADQQRKLAADMLVHQTILAACPICDSNKFRIFVKIFGYDYHECSSCGHIFCASPVDYQSARALYDGVSSVRSLQGQVYLDPNVFEERLGTIARPKVEFVCEALSHWGFKKGGGLWVDIGCGVGEVLVAAREAGFRVRGVESDIEESSFVSSLGIEVENQFLDEHSAADVLSGASVISMVNVLEHIENPIAFLKLARSFCDNAIVVFEVPRHPSLSSLNNKLFPELSSRHIYPPDHLHIFSERSVEALLAECGLKRLATWYFGQDIADLLTCVGLTRSAVDEGELWDQLMNIVPLLQDVIDRSGMSDSMFIVAGKA